MKSNNRITYVRANGQVAEVYSIDNPPPVVPLIEHRLYFSFDNLSVDGISDASRYFCRVWCTIYNRDTNPIDTFEKLCEACKHYQNDIDGSSATIQSSGYMFSDYSIVGDYNFKKPRKQNVLNAITIYNGSGTWYLSYSMGIGFSWSDKSTFEPSASGFTSIAIKAEYLQKLVDFVTPL